MGQKLTKGQVVTAAARCLFCYQAPCQQACPAAVDVPGFIRRLKTGNWRGAAGVIRRANVLGGICARVCPANELCEGACSRVRLDGRAVAIASLQQAAMDTWYSLNLTTPIPPLTGARVAVVGAGPAGVAAAAELVRLGHEVTLYEAGTDPGGTMIACIPASRLPLEVARAEVEKALAGVEVKLGVKVGRDIAWGKLQSEYAAIFIATGLGGGQKLQVPGADFEGVLVAEDFLARAKKGEQPALGQEVIVIGGGNTAMDAAQVARQLGAARVTVVYRRTVKQMPAWPVEYQNALAAGVEFAWLLQPVAILGEDRVTGLRCQRMRLGKADASGRQRPEPVKGAYLELPASNVIIALGQQAGPVAAELGLATTGTGIAVDERGMTSKAGIFAGGDVVNGGRTVVQAVAEGRQAARSIHAYLGTGKEGA